MPAAGATEHHAFCAAASEQDCDGESNDSVAVLRRTQTGDVPG